MESVLYAQYIVATCPRHGQILRLQRHKRNSGDSVHYHSIKGGGWEYKRSILVRVC
jgi:hypothetical protein